MTVRCEYKTILENVLVRKSSILEQIKRAYCKSKFYVESDCKNYPCLLRIYVNLSLSSYLIFDNLLICYLEP